MEQEPARRGRPDGPDLGRAAIAHRGDPHEHPRLRPDVPQGPANDAYAQYLSGRSFNAPLVDGPVPVGNITFEPGCRSSWHIHHGAGGGDQVLICAAGSGWYQAEGEDPVSLTPGTAVRVPAGTKHWHGAKAGSWFSHLAFITPGTDVSNEWLEAVSDEDYAALPESGETR